MTDGLEELEELYKNGMFLDEVVLNYRHTDQNHRDAIENECIRLHNEGVIDLIKLVDDGAIQALSDHSYFSAMHFICKLVPSLVEEPARMMSCINSLVKRAGDDLSSNQPNSAFRLWCQNDPSIAKKIIDDAKDGDELSSSHLTFALESLNAIDEARKIAHDFNDICRLSAITALGRIEDDNIHSCLETLGVFKDILRQCADDVVLCNLLNSVISMLVRSPEKLVDEIVALIEDIVENADEQTMHVAATSLWTLKKNLHPGIVHSFLKLLSRINTDNKGTVNQLDLGLECLLKQGYDKEAVDFVTELIVREDNSLKISELDSFMRALLSGSQESISRVVVKWLLLGEPSLCSGLDGAMRWKGTDGPQLHINATDLPASPDAQKFLCRKLVGWFFMKPTTVASSLVSVLNSCDVEIVEEIRQLLFDPLLINYGSAIKYLKECLDSGGENEHITYALNEYDKYLKSLQNVPAIKELQPSARHRRIEALRKSDEAREIQRQAKGNSALLSMVTQQALLYGDSSISFFKDMDGGLQSMEIDLQPMSWQFEMPRMDVIDPIGVNSRIQIYRMERMAL